MRRKPRPDYVLRAALAYACTQVGSGLLALAPAVGNAGWVGVPIIVLCGLCGAYTSYTLGWTIFRLQAAVDEPSLEESSPSGSDTDGSSTANSSEERFQSYEDVSAQALGIFGRILALVLQGLMLIGVCTIFLVLIGINAVQLEQMYKVEWLTKRQVILLAAALELIPCVLVGTVKETFILTALGALCSAICAVVVVISAFTTRPSALRTCLEDPNASIQWPFVTDLKGLSLCWNTVVFSFGGINVLPALLVDFHSRGVLARALVSFTWRSYLFIIFFYVIVAVSGFAVGGDAMASAKVDSNVLIGLQGCKDSSGTVDWSLLIAFASITLHVVLAMPVPFHACAETLELMLGIREQTLKSSCAWGLFWRLPRLLLLASCTALAYLLPFFGALLNVVAAIAGQATVFILPIILSWAIQRQQKYRIRFYDWLLGILCLFVGVLGGVTGLYYGLNDLVDALKG